MAGHYQHKFKHVPCGLHFIVTSWDSEWKMAEKKMAEKMWCPECGGTTGFIRWKERSEQEIYEIVPGDSRLTAINV